MEDTDNHKAKERIISASLKLFSRKGFDATRVNEIADEANVTKALIYYYFKSKEEILDHLVHSLLETATSITMDFIHVNIIQMIHDGRLDIEPGRLRFADEKAIQHFMKNTGIYFRRLLDFALEHRFILRILMLESLKNSKHHNDLFRLLDFAKGSDENPLFKVISEADRDFTYTDDMTLFKFFFSIIPLTSFAAYYDDYKEISGLGDDELRESFLRSFQAIFTSLISGRDILIKSK